MSNFKLAEIVILSKTLETVLENLLHHKIKEFRLMRLWHFVIEFTIQTGQDANRNYVLAETANCKSKFRTPPEIQLSITTPRNSFAESNCKSEAAQANQPFHIINIRYNIVSLSPFQQISKVIN